VKLRFLIDENLSPKITAAIQRRYPAIDVIRVGDQDAPPLGTLDPDILLYLASSQRVLITDNRQSIPSHIADHFAAGGHHWGIFEVRKEAPIASLIEEIYLYWSASEAEEWIDRVEWLEA
jgi:hypothetical protein